MLTYHIIPAATRK